MNYKQCFFITGFVLYVQVAQSQNIDSLKKVLQHTSESDTTYVKILNRLSWTYAYRQPDSAIIIARNAIEKADKIKFYKGKSMALYIIGAIYFIKLEYDQAEFNVKKALTYAQKHDFKLDINAAYNCLGAIYQGRGDYVRAIVPEA